MGAVSEFEYRYNMTIKTFPSHAEPGFESPAQQEEVWGRRWGCDNDVGQLRMVLMHRPGEEMGIIDPAKRLEHLGSYGDAEGQTWYWRGDSITPLEVQQAQHDGLADALRKEGVEVVYLTRCAPGRHKSIYTRDSCIAVKGGAIVTRLGPIVRRGEELGPDVSMLKVIQTELFQKITDTMMEVAGENAGLLEPMEGNRELNPSGLFLQARPSTIYGGSNEIQRNVLAKNVLALPS
jgi:hypothetical protein